MPWTPPPGGVDDEQMNRPRVGRRVRHRPQGRPEEQLPQRHLAAVDVAADQVRRCGARSRAGPIVWRADDPVAEARREPLDLGLDPLGHVDGAAVRNVAVAPGDVLALPAPGSGRTASAGRAAPAGARPARPAHSASAAGHDLLHRAAQVDRPCPGHLRRAPGDRAIQRPIHLERAEPVLEPLQLRAVRRRQPRRRRSAGPGAASRRAGRPASGSSSTDSTRALVSISPPSERR